MSDLRAAAARLAATMKIDYPKVGSLRDTDVLKHNTKQGVEQGIGQAMGQGAKQEAGRKPSGVLSGDGALPGVRLPHGQLAETADGDVWEIAVRTENGGDVAWRERLLSQVRAALEKKLRDDPQAQELTWRTPLGSVEVRPRGERRAGAPLRLAFASAGRDLVLPRPGAARGAGDEHDDALPDDALPVLRLPDEQTTLLGQRLVGLEAAERGLLLQWGCRWDGALESWKRQTGTPVPPALQEQMQTGHALWLFHGDPGVGKSALARAAADAYCRRLGIAGTVLWLTTQARGEGLVGDFSRRLRAAFRQLAALPTDELKLLVVDEADALAMRRSEAQSHQEDKAATSTLIQALDETAGVRRLAVVLTTNSLASVDAAVQRRARLDRLRPARPGGPPHPARPLAAPTDAARTGLGRPPRPTP